MFLFYVLSSMLHKLILNHYQDLNSLSRLFGRIEIQVSIFVIDHDLISLDSDVPEIYQQKNQM